MLPAGPLTTALQNGDYENAFILIGKGEKISGQVSSFDLSWVLDRVIKDKAFSIIEFFIESGLIKTDLYEYDRFRDSVFQSIIKYLPGDEESIAFMDRFFPRIENLNDEIQSQTLLAYAFDEMANLDVINALIRAGCKLDYINRAEQTYLHQVVQKNGADAEASYPYLVFLLDEGFEVDAQNIERKTPLMMAVAAGKKSYVKLLAEHGADPNLQDWHGESAYFYILGHQQNADLYMLLRNYASPVFDQANSEGATMLFEYIRRMSSGSEKATACLLQLLADGADLFQTSVYYQAEKTSVDILAQRSFDIFSAVLNLDTLDVNQVYDEGETLLHKVCKFNVNFNTEAARDTYKKVKLLLEKGANAGMTNSADQTAIMLASTDNLKVKTVELLLTYTAKNQ